jgi:hypothetical protein
VVTMEETENSPSTIRVNQPMTIIQKVGFVQLGMK